MNRQANRQIYPPKLVYFPRPLEQTSTWPLLLCMLVGGFVAGIGTERVVGPKSPKVFLIDENEEQLPGCDYESLRAMLVMVRDSMNQALVEEASGSSAPEVRQVSVRNIVQVKTPSAALHSGPSESAAVLARLQAGTELLARGKQDGWVEVYSPSGRSGWIRAPFVDSAIEARVR